MSFEIWLLFVVVAIVPAFTPGPAIVLAIANTVRYGAAAALWSSFGNAMGMFVLGMAVTFGLGAILTMSVAVFVVLKYVAMAYLIWLGVKLIRDKSALDVARAPVIPRKRLFWQAFVVSVTNPKAVMLFIALLPGFISSQGSAIEQGLILSATFALVTVVSHRCYALVLNRTRSLLSDARRIRLIRRVLGGSLIGFGLSLTAINRQ